MIEKLAADAILESVFRVKIGGETFKVTPPKNSTIIRLSEMVVNLPEVEEGNALAEVLKHAKDSKIMAEIIALLVCGEIRPLKLYSIKSWITHYLRSKKFNRIKNRVLYDSSPGETLKVLATILGRQDVGSFFALIISLKETNMLVRTREMKTTASGSQ